MARPVRKTENLRKGRVSLPGARYFVTATVEKRKRSFSSSESRKNALAEIERMSQESDWAPVNACVMPEHIHLLFLWNGQTSLLSQTIAKFKTRSRRSIGWKNLFWQENFFERRLRPEEEIERYALYIFLNPYRAGLIQPDQPWDGYRCWTPQSLRFHHADVYQAENIRLWMAENTGQPWES